MPARTVSVNSPSAAPDLGPQKDFVKALRAHFAKASRVSVERTPQGRPRTDRFLELEVEVIREQGESDDECIDAVTKQVFDLIERDADGSPWIGKLHIVDDKATKKSERVLASVSVRINEHAELASAESESVAMMQVARVFMSDMLEKMVKVMGAAAARETAMATMVESVAKWASKGEQRDAKYAWKTTKVEQETERQRVAEIGRTQRQKERWAGIADLGGEYKDVVSAWSEYFLQTLKDGKQPAGVAPTLEVVNVAFADADECRALAAEMVCTADRNTRLGLARKFKAAWKRLAPEAQKVVGLRAFQHLGSEARVRECFAWLMQPFAQPAGL